jgi:hypothetical protein
MRRQLTEIKSLGGAFEGLAEEVRDRTCSFVNSHKAAISDINE